MQWRKLTTLFTKHIVNENKLHDHIEDKFQIFWSINPSYYKISTSVRQLEHVGNLSQCTCTDAYQVKEGEKATCPMCLGKRFFYDLIFSIFYILWIVALTD